MSSKSQVQRKLNICYKTALFVALVVINGVGLSTALAKYIDKDVSREAVVANTFYFSSDYLDVADVDGPPVYTVNGWDGKTKKSFAFVIRNYENPLLFNDSAQDVTYTISYETEYDDKIDVILYKYDPTNDQADTDGYVVVDSGTDMVLEGGADKFNHDSYKITLTSKNEAVSIGEDVSVLITAKTKNTQYIKEISTKLVLQYTEYSNFIARNYVNDYKKSLHALDYIVCTANEQDTTEMVNSYALLATKTLCFGWDKKYLEFDRFDEQLESDDVITINKVETRTTTGTGDSTVTTTTYSVRITQPDNTITDLTGDEARDFDIDVIENYIDDFRLKQIVFNYTRPVDTVDEQNQVTTTIETTKTGYFIFDALPFSQFDFTMHKKVGITDEVWEDTDKVDDMMSIKILGR